MSAAEYKGLDILRSLAEQRLQSDDSQPITFMDVCTVHVRVL